MPSATRLRRRLVRHHVPLGLASAAAVCLFYAMVDSKGTMFRWSMATAYVGFALLGASLALGPLNILRHRPNPVSTDLRRDVGIWGGILSVVHFLVGWQVHMKHRYLYWLREIDGTERLTVRLDAFGFANYTGLAAVVAVVLLLALSNDFALRRLGTARWKTLQRWNYPLFALVLVHAAAYQVIENRHVPYVLLFAAMLLPILLLQAAGFRAQRAARA